MSQIESDERPSTARFTRAVRLTRKGEFSAVFGFRCVVRSTHFSVFAKPNRLKVSRLGLTVPRRILAHAVDRNYAKRTIREVFRRQQMLLAGVDLVVACRTALYRGHFELLAAELSSLLLQARGKCRASCKP